MRLAPVFVISSDRFTFVKETKTLVAEDSDFRNESSLFYQRIYDDACDVGVHIRSERTGKIETFYFAKTNRDAEGDVLSWTFLPVDRSVNCSVVLLND